MTNEATRAFLLGVVLAAVPVAQGAAAQSGAMLPESFAAAAIDPSMRSTLAVPTLQLAAELATDRKKATVKLGFPLLRGWTAEAGVTGAFDRTVVAGQVTGIRQLTDGSSFWGATTWTRPRASRRAAPLLSARVEGSRDDFDFYDMTLAHQIATHAAYAVTTTAGVLLPNDALVAVSYRWSEAWQVGGERESCRVVPATGVTQCPADRIFRRPAPQSRQQLEAQVQTRLGDKFGAELFLTRDFRAHAWGIEVPVYFMARPDGGFTVGTVLNYNDHRERFGLSLFVGQVFRLFK